jgi:AbiV family abortive infection protein
MRVKAIRDLSQLSDSEFFKAVAEGLNLVLRNALKLHDGATVVSQEKRNHPSKVLEAIAEEEAAKFLVLIDSVRCPKQPGERFARQLGRFSDHLAKGLYADACSWRPTTLGQLQEYIDNCRHEFYLDGPNDVDWIFRNEVLQNREGALYVDYVSTDEGHSWTDPGQYEGFLSGTFEPLSLKMAKALSDVGIATPGGRAVVAQIWRPAPLDVKTHCSEFRDLNLRTLQALETGRLLLEQSNDVYSWIVNYWQFPMYDLDLHLIPVELEGLRERQRNWSPDW